MELFIGIAIFAGLAGLIFVISHTVAGRRERDALSTLSRMVDERQTAKTDGSSSR